MTVRRYEKLFEEIKFIKKGLRIGENKILYYNYDYENYFTAYYHPYIKDSDEDDKVMIISNGYDIKIGDWALGIDPNSGIFKLHLKINKFNVVTYNMETKQIFKEPILNISILYKIVNRNYAEGIGYI